MSRFKRKISFKKDQLLQSTRPEKIKGWVLPGFEGVRLYDVFTKLREEIQKDALSVRAASVSFFFILAIFPSIIFFFSLIPYLPVDHFDLILMGQLKRILPEGVYGVLEHTISDIVSIQRGGVTSLNFFLALIFSSNGVSSMIQAFDKMNPTFIKRSFFQKKWVSFKITMLLTFQLIAAIILVIFGEKTLRNLLDFMNMDSEITYLLVVALKYAFVILTFFNTIALIYYFGPSVKKKYRYFSVGATFATLALILLSYTLRFYFSAFSNFNQLYGSLGIVIVVMLWVYLNSFILLFGFELNNSIAVNKALKNEEHQ
jgi:membrane protein